jgi:cytosine/adenosine deaminase-related metal-dependent hydrolase
MMMTPSGISFVNAAVLDGEGAAWDSLRVRRGRVDSLGESPRRGDVVVDCARAVIAPGLINAHDHLELNSFKRLKWRPRYTNVRQWIADFQPRFATDPDLADARRETLADRLWVGGIKNLLCGVTTVCHHNPLHRPLRQRFPVRVVRRFGMSHSLQIDGNEVANSYRSTPATWPWIVHAAEGVDAEARAEVDALYAMRCLGPNTVLVHGVGLDESGARRVIDAGSSLVWCPTSNEFLFGETARVRRFAEQQRVALGSDSRLSGEGDLLDELRAAARTQELSKAALVRTVTVDAAKTLRLSGSGRLAPGGPADVVMLRRLADDPLDSIVKSSRRDVYLTMIDGVPMFGEPRLQDLFAAAGERYAPVWVDGAPRLLARWIAQRAKGMAIREPGLEVSN